MDARYKSIRTVVSAAIALALTGVLLLGILDGGINDLWTSAAAITGR